MLTITDLDTGSDLFFDQFPRAADTHTILDVWSVLEPQTDVASAVVALTCADVAMCAGDTEAAFVRYNEWLQRPQGESAFLPFALSRLFARSIMEPVLPSFFDMASQADPLLKLIGTGALFSLGKWAALSELADQQDPHTDLDWRISAAYGFAKAAIYDYAHASGFFVPAILQGYGLAVPHNGANVSISQAAEEAAMYARQYGAAAHAAERALVVKGFTRINTAAPLDATKIDLFIKTCAKDEQFLVYCLRSIDQFVTGFRRVVIVTDEGHDCNFQLNYDHVIHKIAVPEAPTTFAMPPGYRMQMVAKLQWMDFTDADAVVITDSDTIFTGAFSPEQMIVEGRPVWYHGEWYEGVLWRAASELVVGAPMPHCCMREHPFIFTKDATIGFLDYIDRRFNCSIFDLFFGGIIPGRFCEFEILGGYLLHIASHGYALLPHEYKGILRQYWSWGGFTEEVEANVKKHLQLETQAV